MKRKGQRGAVAVEFAFILPLLLAIVFAVFQFSWYISNYLMLTDAAAVGAHVLASERGYTKPYTDTQTAIFGVTKPLSGKPTIVASVGGVTCSSDSACQAALGTMTAGPATGAVANVSLTYAFSPILNTGLWDLTSMMPTQIKASMAEAIQ
ncbi:MAG TPA: TadE/TadG family type IV pilus assembly protein [Trinickia sp.]|uniref:TadE/TadG family type IV pilus assembly protein n=1 Tax=Trinickia sp. TaxID=2571163 RepID=UPI002CFBF655|nr:TadE/TadG family type IV pilus assembly protein [Trinickia sp.]HVW50117.1 TadE/TadG family type IV pilus assembly protein [Trinickia sp.]